MTDFTGDWATKELRVPRTQPFLKEWLVANHIDPATVDKDVRLRLGRMMNRFGQIRRWAVLIVTHPILHTSDKSVVVSGQKAMRGKEICELIVWPDGVERVPEWDEMVAREYELA